jgi:hypothetical protein
MRRGRESAPATSRRVKPHTYRNMSIFNETEHPRAAAGQFTDKQQSAPELSLTIPAEADPFLQRDLALDPSTSAADIADLVDQDNWVLDTWIARHPNIDSESLATIFDRADTRTRTSVVANANASAETLHLAVTDPATDVRMMAAAHPTLEPDDQNALAADALPQIQSAVLSNPSLTTDALATLRATKFNWVLERLAARDGQAAA